MCAMHGHWVFPSVNGRATPHSQRSRDEHRPMACETLSQTELNAHECSRAECIVCCMRPHRLLAIRFAFPHAERCAKKMKMRSVMIALACLRSQRVNFHYLKNFSQHIDRKSHHFAASIRGITAERGPASATFETLSSQTESVYNLINASIGKKSNIKISPR